MLGIYDSGQGGLTILEAIIKQTPDIDYQYVADYQALPIGEKSTEYIIDRVKTACRFLFDRGCSILVLACNTASVTAIRHIQQVWLPLNYPDKQVLSISKPFLELMQEDYEDLKQRQGLLMATPKTIYTGFYQSELKRLGFKKIQNFSSPGLVEAIEAEDKKQIWKTMDYLLAKNKLHDPKSINFVLLACTHYKLAQKYIDDYFDDSCQFIEPGQKVATCLKDYLHRHLEFKVTNSGHSSFWVTGNDKFYPANHWLADSQSNAIQKINLPI